MDCPPQTSESVDLRIAAGCSLACPFCDRGQGREGAGFEAFRTGAFPIPPAAEYRLGYGDLVVPDSIPVVERLRNAGGERVIIYAHTAVRDPGVLADLRAAGLTGVHLVLPSAERQELARLTGGGGRLATAVKLLDQSERAGLDVLLEVPVTGPNHARIADTIRRALNRGPAIRKVVLTFASFARAGDPGHWDLSRARGPVSEALAAGRERGIPVVLRGAGSPPPCVLGEADGDVELVAELGFVSGDVEFQGPTPFPACSDCAIRCGLDARHHRSEGPAPLPLAKDSPLARRPDPPTVAEPLEDSPPAGAPAPGAAADSRAGSVDPELSRLADEVARTVACTAPWVSMEYLGNSKVLPCCQRFLLPPTQEGMSDWLPGGLLAAWNSPGMRAVRRAIASGRPLDTCSADCIKFPQESSAVALFCDRPRTPEVRQNTLLAMREMLDGVDEVASRPQTLTVAITPECNIRCVMCSLEDQRTKAGVSGPRPLPDERFEEIESLFPTLRLLTLTGGEPLCEPRAVRLIRHFGAARYPDGGVALITNGLLLTPRLVDRISGSRLHQVIVSLNAASPATYERITGRGGGFGTVTGNLRSFQASRGRFPQPPNLLLSFVAMRDNYRELPDFLALAAGLDAGVRLLPVFGDLGGQSLFTDHDTLESAHRFIQATVAPIAASMGGSARSEVDMLSAILGRRLRQRDYSLY